MRVLITGITGNIGRAASKHFLSQGWQVVGVSRNPPPFLHDYQVAQPELYSLNLCLDVDIAHWLSEQDPFDLVVMAHGVQWPCELGKADTIDVFHTVIDGNLTSAFYLTNQLIEQDKLNEGALVVYCSSIQATQTRAGRIPYGMAKAGLEVLANGLSVEGKRNGWRGVALRLGQLDFTMRGITFSPEQVKSIEERLLAPMVPCADVAQLILDLYSQKSLIGTINFDSGHHLSVWP